MHNKAPRDRRYVKQYAIERKMGWKDYESAVKSLYQAGHSGIEIAAMINQDLPEGTPPLITPRSIQRRMDSLGISRSVGDSFRLAISKGRVKWAYKSDKIKRVRLRTALRWEILKRDDYRCQTCGVTSATAILEVDHVIPVHLGGTSNPANLRTLCHECNVGRAIFERNGV